MANLPQNKAYAIMNYGATLNGENEKRLNLYYNGSISNGQNVCLWDTDYSTEQKWIFVGDKLKTARNQNFVLDRHITTNNADVWQDLSSEDANQKVVCELIPNSSDIYTIRLKTGGKYLTAVNSSNGTSSGTSSTSSGNVYWSDTMVGNMSMWRFFVYSDETYPDEPETGNQKLVLPIQQCKLNASYKNAAYQNTYTYIHYGVDFGSTARTSSGEVDRTVYASGNGVVIAKGWDEKAGYVMVVKYPNAYHKTTQTYKDVIFRYFHFNSLNASLSVGDSVTTATVLGEYGGSGLGAMDTWSPHLHVEADTDTNYPCYSPTFGTGGGIIIGTSGGANDSTMSSPLTWLYVGEGMTYTTAGDQYINAGDETLESI